MHPNSGCRLDFSNIWNQRVCRGRDKQANSLHFGVLKYNFQAMLDASTMRSIFRGSLITVPNL